MVVRLAPSVHGNVTMRPRISAGSAMFAAMDAPPSSEYKRALLGWELTAPGLVADIDQASHFGS
jgi:hypothetical protein